MNGYDMALTNVRSGGIVAHWDNAERMVMDPIRNGRELTDDEHL